MTNDLGEPGVEVRNLDGGWLSWRAHAASGGRDGLAGQVSLVNIRWTSSSG